MITNKTIRDFVIAKKLFKGSEVITDVTIKDNIVTFESNNTLPLKKCTCFINPIQEGTGDPSPSNPRPISGTSALNVEKRGKNLCDLNTKSPTTSATVNVEVKSDNEIIMNGTATGGTCDLLVSLKKNIIFDGINPLTISLTGTDIRTANMNVYLRKKDNSFSLQYGILVDTHSVTIPTSFIGEVKEIMFRISRGESVNIDAKVQIELGSTATTYEPYTGSTYTVNLGQTVYGGSADVVGGSGKENHEKTTVPTITAFSGSSGGYNYVSRNITGMKTTGAYVNDIISDKLKSITTLNAPFGVYRVAYTYVVTVPDTYTVQDFNDNIAGAELIYPLETPTDFTFTPKEIRTNEGENTFYHDGNGEIEVTYQSVAGQGVSSMQYLPLFYGKDFYRKEY